MSSFWQDDDDQTTPFRVPDDVVDLNFRLQGREIPAEHAQALADALLAQLPWLREEPAAAIHSIHVAESGNGWMRPSDRLQLSRRTRLTLRLPQHRVASAQALEGRQLQLAESRILLGDSSIRPLSAMTTVFSRYVDSSGIDSEDAFLHQVVSWLQALGIRPRKLLAGREHQILSHSGTLQTRSVMLADLEAAESVRLQQAGLGPNRLLGCGIFLPHKGIDAVHKASDNLRP